MMMSVRSSLLSIPFHRAYTACFTVLSPFSTSKKSTSGDDLNKLNKDKDKEKVNKYVVSEEDLTILSTYKEIVGDLDISARFKVPKKDPWPKAFHGYALGKVVSIINRHKNFNTLSVKSLAKLEKIGFQQKPQTLTVIGGQHTSKLHNFEHVREALLAYKVKYGDLLVPFKYSIPVNDNHFAEHLRGLKLGSMVQRIRNKDKFSNHKAVLLAMGFQYENINRPRNFEHVKEALLTYESIFGDLLVFRKYIVPEDDPRYSSHLHGMELGYVVSDIRNKNYYSKHREELVAMGFPYESQIYDFEEIKEALLAYKDQYGDLLVPAKYSIPVNDNHYAEHLWGIQLGNMVSNIRNGDAYSNHKAELLAMGFQYENINRPPNFEHVKEALLTYKSIHGDLLVPRNYIVPEDDPRYASHLRGMKLGYVVSDIRNKNTYSKHREELVAMGFRYERYARLL